MKSNTLPQRLMLVVIFFHSCAVNFVNVVHSEFVANANMRHAEGCKGTLTLKESDRECDVARCHSCSAQKKKFTFVFKFT